MIMIINIMIITKDVDARALCQQVACCRWRAAGRSEPRAIVIRSNVGLIRKA